MTDDLRSAAALARQKGRKAACPVLTISVMLDFCLTCGPSSRCLWRAPEAIYTGFPGLSRMGLTGACSNQPTSLLLAEANRARAALVAQPGASSPRTIVSRPKPMQPIIVLVLQASDVPLTIADIVQRVERVLGRSVHRPSVKAALSEMAGSTRSPVQRVSRGRYGARLPDEP